MRSRTTWAVSPGVLLMGLLTGKEAEADAFVRMVAQEVDRLKALAGEQPRRSVLWAWYKSAGNRWAVTQRNAIAALIRDANAELVLGADDDPELDTFSELSTERLLRDATSADCWMIRDPLSAVFDDRAVLSRFQAYRDGCVFWEQGRRHPDADTWELWEMGAIRPDWQLADIMKMLHPQLRDGGVALPRTGNVGGGPCGRGSALAAPSSSPRSPRSAC